jgi:hypothetical protein
MNIKAILTFLAVASVSLAQSATLIPDRAEVGADTEITLTASINYAETPSAMGWSIVLPAGWSYVGTRGPDVPAVTPQAGATGTLEWAYTESPASTARFAFTVKASGTPGARPLTAQVLLRTAGQQTTVAVAPVTVTVTP